MGAGSRLAEQSLLARDQRIPDGGSWGGSPAAPAAEADPLLDAMEAAGCAATRWSGRLWAASPPGSPSSPSSPS